MLARNFELSSRLALVANKHPAQSTAESFLVAPDFNLRPLHNNSTLRSISCENKLHLTSDRILLESAAARKAISECVNLALSASTRNFQSMDLYSVCRPCQPILGLLRTDPTSHL